LPSGDETSFDDIDSKVMPAPLAHELAHRVFSRVVSEHPAARIWLHNRKRPSGEEGRFWGYYREERYVSLYMWIRGR